MLEKALKIFKLQQYDFPHMIDIVSYMFKSLTIYVDSRNTKRCPLIFNIIMGILGACNIYVYFISVMWFVFWRCRQVTSCDLVSLIVNFSLGVGSYTGGAPKLIFILFNQAAIRRIVDGYMACNALVVPGSRFSTNLLEVLHDVKKRISILWIIVVLNDFMYIISPALIPGRHLMEDKQVLLGLEPSFESPNYELTLLIVGCGVNFICYVCLVTSTIFMIMTGYTEAQMTALSIELANLWDDAQNHYLEITKATENPIESTDAAKYKILNQYVRRHLIDIVKRHTMNVNLVRQLEFVFRGALATEFILLFLGLISELLGGLENTYLEVLFTFLQAAIDCWTGQLLINASEKFKNTVYDCKWENFDSANMKMVLLMLQNSQRTLKLSAGGVATLSYSCLMSIMKSIFSTYTTLRSTMKT